MLRWGNPLEPPTSWDEISPSPLCGCAQVGGCVAQAVPRQASPPSPALGGPGRPQTVGTGPACWVLARAKLFFPLSKIFLSRTPFTWLPTQAFMQRRVTITVLVETLSFSASESTLGLSVLFQTLEFCGHIIPRHAHRLSLGTFLPVAVVMV